MIWRCDLKTCSCFSEVNIQMIYESIQKYFETLSEIFSETTEKTCNQVIANGPNFMKDQ